jgi:hypothetical protein
MLRRAALRQRDTEVDRSGNGPYIGASSSITPMVSDGYPRR